MCNAITPLLTPTREYRLYFEGEVPNVHHCIGSLQPHEVGIITVAVLHVRKLRLQGATGLLSVGCQLRVGSHSPELLPCTCPSCRHSDLLLGPCQRLVRSVCWERLPGVIRVCRIESPPQLDVTYFLCVELQR